MDDYTCPFCLAQLLVEVSDLLNLVRVVLALWSVRDVDVGSNVVGDEAAGSRECDMSNVIEASSLIG